MTSGSEKTALALRHVAFEDCGAYGGLLQERGFSTEIVDVPLQALDSLEIGQPDLVIILGGPIGVYEEADYPFLRAELKLVEQRIRSGKPVLGICLGCQLMARAMGGRVFSSGKKEIGWSPLTLTDAGKASPLALLQQDGQGAGLETGPVLHWHGDTYDLPEGAEHLAGSAMFPQQAFAFGSHALALQFHAEVDDRALESWFVGHAAEIAGADGITVPGLRADTARFGQDAVMRGKAMFGAWLESCGL